MALSQAHIRILELARKKALSSEVTPELQEALADLKDAGLVRVEAGNMRDPQRLHLTQEGALQRLESIPSDKRPPPSGKPPPPRLTVDLARKTITLDGVTHDISSERALRWVKALALHPGEWISSTELKKHDAELDGVRPDRLKKHLPSEVLSLIESDRRKGSRLHLPG
jgi:hypothetical protein